MIMALVLAALALAAALVLWLVLRDIRSEKEAPRRFGFLDTRGQEIIAPAFEEAQGFSEGLAAVKAGGLWGYIDRAGTMVIPPYFGQARPFAEGAAAVKVGGALDGADWGFIGIDGHWLIEPRFHDAGRFSGGYARVTFETANDSSANTHRNGYVDRSGTVALEDPAWSAGLDQGHFQADGRFPVALDGGFGFMDRDGRRIGQTFAALRAFSGGRAAVAVREGQVDGGDEKPLLWGYIDTEGNWVVSPWLDHAGDFREGLALAGAPTRQSESGQIFFRTDGSQLPGSPFMAAEGFQEGLAPVKTDDDRVYWINAEGAVALEADLELPLVDAEGFHDGIARVCLAVAPMMVNMGTTLPGETSVTGNLVPPPNLDYFVDRQARVVFSLDRDRYVQLQAGFAEGRMWFARAADRTQPGGRSSS